MNVPTRTTPLFDWHTQAGARMAEFAQYQMPIQYSSIVAEHTATRTAAGLFDISHMGDSALKVPEPTSCWIIC